MKVAKIIYLLLLLILAELFAQAQTAPWSDRMAATAMNSLWKDAPKNEAGSPARWTYDQELVLKGLESSPNDPKGVGAFLLASNELEIAGKQSVGKGKTVVLDYYFNNETKKDATGQLVPYHYKWEETVNSGFSVWASVFSRFGVKTEALTVAPTASNLKKADIYIIVDPDTKEETEHPNFIEPQHVKAITDWVKSGGVLVLMGNDVGNAEFDHFNELARKFGIQFNKDSRNRVQGNNYDLGRIVVSPPHPVFKTARSLFLKEISTLRIVAPARALLEDNGDVIMAVAKLGKGTVFAVGDPWLYNEYVDGRKLPADFDNFKAAEDLTQWLIQQSQTK